MSAVPGVVPAEGEVLFSWDGEIVVLGDEMGGAAVSPGCATGGSFPTGALWFYDVSDPESPEMQSSFVIPQNQSSALCTAHNFNVVPLRSDSRILVTGWYDGGSHVLDFTDPQNVEQIGYYIAHEEPSSSVWSAYWYDGFVWANNFQNGRGFDVFAIDDPAVEDHIALPRLNPQTQEPLPAAPAEEIRAAPAPRDEGPGAADTLPATGVSAVPLLGALAALAAAGLARRPRHD